jgi:hypothetical protein
MCAGGVRTGRGGIEEGWRSSWWKGDNSGESAAGTQRI